MFEHQISITSETGAGKSSLFKALKNKLVDSRYRWVSGGGLFRGKANELGMTVEQFAEYNRLHPEKGYDKWVDGTITKMAESDWMICESRLSHFFMPGAFKVLLKCDINTRAERRQKDFPGKSLEEIRQAIEERDKNDNARYAKLYPGCLWEKEKFDLVLSTEVMSSEVLAGQLVSEYELWQKRHQSSLS